MVFHEFISLFSLQVDSSKKLGTICGVSAKVPKGCNCAIVIRDTKIQSPISQNRTPLLSKQEQILADFYESTSGIFPTPIIDLPIWNAPIGKQKKKHSRVWIYCREMFLIWGWPDSLRYIKYVDVWMNLVATWNVEYIRILRRKKKFSSRCDLSDRFLWLLIC